jgi:N-acetylmuramoyl-L-alanine amidase
MTTLSSFAPLAGTRNLSTTRLGQSSALVFSRFVLRKALAATSIALVLAVPLAARQAATADDAATVVSSGVGTLVGDGSERPLPWIETENGPLVALESLVGRLGGELVTGPFGTSFELVLGDATFVVAAESPALTRGTEILPLSQAPQIYLATLYVPLDLIPRTWGELAGVRASWDPTNRRLSATRPAARKLTVDLSIVHLQGVSTVVLRFPAAPRCRIEARPGGFDVIAVGDRFVVPRPRSIDDPYLRTVSVSAERIRLDLAAGVDAEHYRLAGPDRIVFDLFPAREEAHADTQQSTRGRPGIRTVVLDPGHGGSETGATGPAGTMEKELTLLIARSLAERLSSQLGLRTVLTRTDDVDLDLDERSAFANQNKADLFISIHLNSVARGDAHGAETYFLSLQASDQYAADAAALENVVGSRAATPGSDEFDLQLMLWDLAQSSYLAASQQLATFVQQELNRQLNLPDRGVKQAPFRVLMGAAMPAVLVELGFLSSAEEEQRLRDPAYRAELVGTLVRAIARFRADYDASRQAGGVSR